MEGITYSVQYSLVQLVAGDVFLYICLRGKKKDDLSCGHDLILVQV